MKPAILWKLRDQQAFDRAMELQFSRAPNKQKMIEGFRQRLVEGIERAAPNDPLDPNTERSVKYMIQRKGYQNEGDPPPTPQPVEEWLEVRYRFVDDGKTAEVTSVTSAKFPDI